MSKVLSTEGNNYSWSKPVTLISHAKSEFPWVEDPHLYYDESSKRLWLSWGGGTCYVSEMDPQTGLFLNHQANPEFDTHPKEMHHAVAVWPETHDGWCGDAWSSCWMEGAALYKHNDFWYYLAAYGNMNKNYTIRYGRGSSPTGPFYDKKGLMLTEFDAQRKQYGNTILLGAEGNQLVPGHPHIWKENGKYYLGYDFRSDLNKEQDMMGIRRLYWVNDWPTIYMPVTVSFNSNDYPEINGKELAVAFRNAGDKNSIMAVDFVTVNVSNEK
jgi:beta-xylosidase